MQGTPVNRRPLSRASRPFIWPTLKGSNAWNSAPSTADAVLIASNRQAERLSHLGAQDLERLEQRLGACVNSQVRLGIEGGAAGEDGLQILHRLRARRHGPEVALGRDPRHVVFRVRLQPGPTVVQWRSSRLKLTRSETMPPAVAITASG